MPVDKKLSNENWTVCEIKCPCGGESKINLED